MFLFRLFVHYSQMRISTAIARRRKRVAFLKYIFFNLVTIVNISAPPLTTTTCQLRTKLSPCSVSSSMSISCAGGQQHHSHQMTILTCHLYTQLTFCSVSSSMSISFTGEQQHHFQTTIATCHRHTKLSFCLVSSSM
jgi:hypothetical protein